MMSSDAADVNLSNSAGKSGQLVQRSSTRVRKPNSSLKHEGVSLVFTNKQTGPELLK